MEEVYNAGNVNADNITTTEMGGAPEDTGATGFTAFTEKGSVGEVYGGIKDRPDPSTLSVDEDGIIQYITPDMIIGDIITWYPDAALVLMKCGMHCISCGVSQFESLDQACAVHGLYTDDVAKVVNDYLTQTLGDKKED